MGGKACRRQDRHQVDPGRARTRGSEAGDGPCEYAAGRSQMNHAPAMTANALPVDQYQQAFQEEAREILVELESTLLELNEHPEDSELVGKAFRALHTIKGSGAMFGFEEVAAFTHNLENAFDRVRNGRLPVTSDLIDLSLAALDQIKAMLQFAGWSGRRR